jgi:predicted cupin superfamily sugar epimerase
MTPGEIITTLDMRPHPEGGHYVETWRGRDGADGRAVGTAIYFLLSAGERSHWHRVDADETWLFHGGAPLELSIAADGGTVHQHRLGIELAAGELPQCVVPAGAWQSAVSSGGWTLVSCIVTPGFEFDGFELASSDWSPDSA